MDEDLSQAWQKKTRYTVLLSDGKRRGKTLIYVDLRITQVFRGKLDDSISELSSLVKSTNP